MRLRLVTLFGIMLAGAISAAAQTTTTSTTTNVPAAKAVDTLSDNDPHFPPGLPTAPTRSVKGTIRSVQCYYPTILSITFQQAAAPEPIAKSAGSRKSVATHAPANSDEAGKFVTLYTTNNFYKVNFFTLNFTPPDPIQPCSNIVGLKATILFTETSERSNPSLIGQLTQVQLAK